MTGQQERRSENMKRLLTALSFAAAAMLPAQAAPALWSVSDEDTTVYLFGTIHYLPPELDWRTEAFDAAFDEADQLCLEVNIFDRAEEVMQLTFRDGLFLDGQRLSDFLSDEEETNLQTVAEEVGILWIGLDMMKPWNAMLNLSGGLAVKAGFSSETGVEAVLYGDALMAGIPICEMETIDQQLGGLMRLPMDEQVKVLTMVDEDYAHLPISEQLEMAIGDLRGMADGWSVGDVSGLVSAPADMGSEAVYAAIFTDRNARWADKIEAMLDEPGTTFIAVGAGHLAGPDSVQAMLEDKGITVEGPDYLRDGVESDAE